jgi:site-specific recombinase XerD
MNSPCKAVDCLVKFVVKKALIQKRVHPHVMRHTFATTLLDNGNDLKTVQALMGHSHIRTTERYLHSTDDRKVEAIRSLQFAT